MSQRGGGGANQVGFGEMLRAYRERRLLSQDQLAERSGLSARTIRGLETGKVRHPRSASVRLLADGLRLAGWEREQFEAAARTSAGVEPLRAQQVASADGEVAPCQLPPGITNFVGRADLVGQLQQLLKGRPTGPAGEADAGAVVVSAVAGKAGVGKSALAVHVAHQLAVEFPDGQLYASLRGAGAGGVSPLDPAEILGRFLRALGVDGGAIPAGVGERAALYRSRLAGRQVLVVLDDAADEAQVSPLLPGSPSAAVLITSRARLAALKGARLVHLDVLDAGQAVELLARIAGPGRVAAEPQAATAIAVACGGLPLAVRIAGARLAARPHWPLARLAGRLADERGRLEELAHGDLEVRVSLSLSYQGLGKEQRRLFRRLGLLDALDVAAWVAAALLDSPVPRGEALLEDLVEAQLLGVAGWDVTGRARYRLHDLLHAYARERVHAEEPLAQRQAALERTLGGWLALAERGGRVALSNRERALEGRVASLAAAVPSLDTAAETAARRRQAQLIKPTGSLGQLEELGVRLAAMAGRCPPPVPARAAVLVAAGDHGVVAQGVTPWPQAVTSAMVGAMGAGLAAVNAIAGVVGAELCLLDVGVAAPPATEGSGQPRGSAPPGQAPLVRSANVRRGTADLAVEPAMSRQEAARALLAGAAAASELLDGGADLLVTGDMGIGNTTPAACLVAAFTGQVPAAVTGRGTGVDDATWELKVKVVERALARHAPDPADPIGALASVGGLEHAALAGLLLAGASRRVPVLLDGVNADAAALVACALAPRAGGFLIAGHRSVEPGASAALHHLGLPPLVDLRMRLGEGTGALLAVPIVRAAAAVLARMATFAEAGFEQD